ncbi:MAG: flagellar basal body rod protein FlgB [Clostridiales bacterium]|nr:flagellar basal body rod protein FlgB [Clostridiales bacterium]
MLNNIHNQASILGAALKGLSARNDVIQNNIANADTMNFKKSAVDFEDSLRDALVESYNDGGRFDQSKVTATARFEKPNYFYRLDGNNVDVELEMADLYKNGAKYDAISTGVMNYYKRIMSVLR